jgi:putative ATP-dependent endonuclease of the OLD family
MRLAAIAVAGFRPLRDVYVPLDDLTVLLGPNGSGKSSLLAALRLFFEPRATLDERDVWRGVRESPSEAVSVAVTFDQLSEAATESFGDYLDEHGQLRLERHFNEPGHGVYLASRAAIPAFTAIRNLPKGHRDAYNELVDSGQFDELERARSKDDAFEHMSTWEDAHPDACEVAAEEVPFVREPAGSRTAVATYLTFHFVGALEEPSLHLDAEGQGAMGALIREVVDTGELEQELAAITDEADKKARKTLESLDEVFSEFEQSTAGSLERFAPGYGVHLSWEDDVQTSARRPRIKATIRHDDGFEAALEYQGHGIQRSLMYGVLTAQAATDRPRTARTLVLAIEEPEAFQHPLSARVLASTLRELAGRGYQVIHTTHSPDLLSASAIRGLRLVTRPHDASRRAETQVDAFSMTRLAERMTAATGLDSITEESLAARLDANLERHVLEGLFAQACVLVEGDEDEALIRGACEHAGIMLDTVGVAIVQTRGKRSMPLVLGFLTQAGVRCFPAFDLDRNKAKEADQQRDAERQLLALLGVDPATPLQETTVQGSYACFERDLGATVAEELGEIYLDAIRHACDTYGYTIGQGRKVAPVLRDAIHQSAEAGVTSPTLEALASAVSGLRR